MALIQVTPDLLNSKANDLRTLKGQHDEAMSKMRTLIMGLNEVWKGDAQDAFVAKYESMQSTFSNFSQMLEDYAKLMNTAAQKLQETDQTLQTTMNSFGGRFSVPHMAHRGHTPMCHVPGIALQWASRREPVARQCGKKEGLYANSSGYAAACR